MYKNKRNRILIAVCISSLSAQHGNVMWNWEKVLSYVETALTCHIFFYNIISTNCEYKQISNSDVKSKKEYEKISDEIKRKCSEGERERTTSKILRLIENVLSQTQQVTDQNLRNKKKGTQKKLHEHFFPLLWILSVKHQPKLWIVIFVITKAKINQRIRQLFSSFFLQFWGEMEIPLLQSNESDFFWICLSNSFRFVFICTLSYYFSIGFDFHPQKFCSFFFAIWFPSMNFSDCIYIIFFLLALHLRFARVANKFGILSAFLFVWWNWTWTEWKWKSNFFFFFDEAHRMYVPFIFIDDGLNRISSNQIAY